MVYMVFDVNFFLVVFVNDGFMDFIIIQGDVSLFKFVGFQMVVDIGEFFDSLLVIYCKILVYCFILCNVGKGGYLSIDGEVRLFELFQVEIY